MATMGPVLFTNVRILDGTGQLPYAGSVLVQGELWKAWSAEPIPAGARVKVLAVRGLMLEVAPEKEKETT